MAKFNVTVDIEYLDIEGNLDDSICEQIVQSVVDRVCKNVTESVEKKAVEAFDKQLSDLNVAISARLNEMMEEFFNTPKDVTDRWGDVVERGVTVKGKLKAACDNFMFQPVDERGNAAERYNIKYKTRVDYFVAQSTNQSMQNAIEKAVRDVTDNLKAKISDEIKKQMGSKLAGIIGLDDIIKTKA